MFYNVFNKAKPREEKKPLIIIDNREKNSLVPSNLVNLGAKIEFKQLEIGDYIIKDTIIERKTIQDLKSSLINRRIISQIKELKQHKSLILIEGISDEDIYSGTIHENALRGFLLSLTLEQKMPLIFTKDAEDSAKYLYILAKKEEKTEHEPLLAKRKPESPEEQKQFILEGFPGIGPQTAKKLLDNFKSIKNIINTSQEDLEKLIGKKAENFKRVLD